MDFLRPVCTACGALVTPALRFRQPPPWSTDPRARSRIAPWVGHAGLFLLVAACDFDPGPATLNTSDAGPSSDAGGDGGPADAADIGVDVGVPPPCGNGVLDELEECDDEDVQALDGCSATCDVEPGWRCEGVPSTCERLPDITFTGSEVAEGERLRFDLVFSSTVPVDVPLSWAVIAGTARAPMDFVGEAGTATIAAGEIGTVIEIDTNDDREFEMPETVVLALLDARVAFEPAPTATATIGPPRLTNRGAVVRYFLDEQPSGEPTADVFDALEPDPVDLTAQEAGVTGPVYVTLDGGRGLAWDDLTSLGRVEGPAGQNKIEALLDGAQAFTIEIRVDLTDANANSRLLHLGPADDQGALAMVFSPDEIRLDRTTLQGLAEWATTVVNAGPVLVTLTIDSTEPDPLDRAELFINGVPDVGPRFSPQLDEALAVGDQDVIVIGNSSMGGRAAVGSVSYVALYNERLELEEIERNAHRLGVTNDTRPAQ